MADELRMALEELLRKAELERDADFLREGVGVLSQALMELEVTQHLGAERHERTAARTGQRNGYRERDWDTRVGTVELRVPRVRDGSYFPSLLEPRRRAERALAAVVQEAYVQGVSTRRVDELVRALGLEGVSKSQVSALVGRLDPELAAWRTRPLTGAAYPYLVVDARYEHARVDGRVVSLGVLVVAGVRDDGRREILAVAEADTESEATYQALFQGLKDRGLRGVELVTSDDHRGLKAAIDRQVVEHAHQ